MFASKSIKQIVTIVTVIIVLILSGCTANNMPAAPAAAKTGPSNDKEDLPEEEHTEGRSHLPAREEIALDADWKYADMAVINTGQAVMYRTKSDRKDIVIGVNAGHGTSGGEYSEVYCHPDRSPKITKGSNPSGSLKAVAVSAGMIFADGTPEADVTLLAAQSLRDSLLARGYDVLMLRDEEDVRLDNVARTVIANNKADCLVSLHWDGDGRSYDKGCFYIAVPDEIKEIEPVSRIWQEHERLGDELIKALSKKGCIIYYGRNDPLELTQTCYATIPAVVIELGNGASSHEDADIAKIADGLVHGIESYYGN
ncbi:MAG: N-acetylmuramoyl-L-alanine amidase [Lachnospiraceae bacterium]|nr:N-acetylmuramoyl-L-alanine amidase [Lachnospiraceae bacterium]